MKKMKKRTALLLTLVMSLALAVPCFAAARSRTACTLSYSSRAISGSWVPRTTIHSERSVGTCLWPTVFDFPCTISPM